MWMYIFLVMTYKSECKPSEHNADYLSHLLSIATLTAFYKNKSQVLY